MAKVTEMPEPNGKVLAYNKSDLICQVVYDTLVHTGASSSVMYLLPIFQSESETGKY